MGSILANPVYVKARRVFARLEGVGLLSAAALVSAIVSFLVNLVTARALGPDGRGAVALVLQIAYISAPLAAMGYPPALLRKGSEGPGLLSGGRLGVIIILVILSPAVVLLYGPWYLLFVLVGLVTVAFQVQRSLAIVVGSYQKYFLLFTLYQGSVLLGSLLLWLVEVGQWQWWVVVYAVPGVLVLLLSFGSPRFSLNLKTLLRANVSFIWASISQLILLRSERLIIGALLGSGPLGVYVVVATATEPLYWVAQSLADSRSASSYKYGSRRTILLSIFRDSLVFGVVASVGGVLLSIILVPVFGKAFEPGKDLILPLIVGVVVLALYRQAAGVALVRSGTKALGLTEGLLAGVALIVYFVAISLFDVMGAAWACVVVYAFGFVALLAVALTGAFDSTRGRTPVVP